MFSLIWLLKSSDFQDLPVIIVLNSFTQKMFGLKLKTLIVFPVSPSCQDYDFVFGWGDL